MLGLMYTGVMMDAAMQEAPRSYYVRRQMPVTEPAEAERIHARPVEPVAEHVKPVGVTDQCWNEVDWGLVPSLPVQSETLTCSSGELHHNTMNDKVISYCLYPKGTQLNTHALQSKAALHTVKEDGGAHDPRYPLDAHRISYCRSSACETCTRRFGETLLLTRKDDHNPFFMLSILLNAWLLHGNSDMNLLMYDDAGVQPVDDVFRKLLSPSQEILYANNMLNEVLCFDKLWKMPGEYVGPLMVHLNDEQPCGRSQMVESFAQSIFELYPNTERTDDRTTVTFVGRKHYNGRTIGRVWTNEKAVVEALQQARPDLNVRLVYYEELSFAQQIHVDRTTDIMVGMHGAGMVHVLFLPENSRVIEIFPKHKRRWGYRNIAQYRGLSYVDYRGGKDGAHDSKVIEPNDWIIYFNEQVSTISHGENRITDKILELIPDGHVFVEMGANDGENSNTHMLEQLGWAGLCIEAGPSNFIKLKRNRPKCANINAVVSDVESTAIFREFPSGGLYGHSGLKDARSDAAWESLISAHRATFIDHTVRTTTMTRIYAENHIQTVDYFSLDVEGAEMSILRNYPFEKYPVKVWSIESNKLDRSELLSFMREHGYSCQHFDAINTICQIRAFKTFDKCIASSLFIPTSNPNKYAKLDTDNADTLLPSWKRIYFYDDSVSVELRQKINNTRHNIMWIHKEKSVGRSGTFWRFEAVDLCSLIIFRDIEMQWHANSDVWALLDFQQRHEKLGYIQLVHNRGVCHDFEVKRYGRCRRQVLGGVYMVKPDNIDFASALGVWENRHDFGQDEYFLTETIHTLTSSVVYYDPDKSIKDSLPRPQFNETYIAMPRKWKMDISSSSCSEQPKKLEGMMKQTEQTFLETFITTDSTYFEWGSGGSTDTFGRLTNAKIVSVENYQPWCDKVSALPFVKCRQQLKTMDYKCIVPHPTGGAGYPVDSAHNGAFDEYIEAIQDYPDFDIVLVDGRWRIACALFALDYITDDTVVFIHDFQREEYRVVLEWYDTIDQVDALIALKRKKNVARPTLDILNTYKNRPGP